MLGADMHSFVLLLSKIPGFVLCGMMTTRVSSMVLEESKPVFVTRDEYSDSHREFGGSAPAVIGAVLGVLCSIVVEAVLVGAVVAGHVFGPLTASDAVSGTLFATLFGVAIAYRQSFECQSRIRGSRWYRGWR